MDHCKLVVQYRRRIRSDDLLIVFFPDLSVGDDQIHPVICINIFLLLRHSIPVSLFFYYMPCFLFPSNLLTLVS